MSSRGKTRSSELSSPSKISTKRIKESSSSSSNGPQEEDFMTKIVEQVLERLSESMEKAIERLVDKAVKSVNQALEARIAALEAKIEDRLSSNQHCNESPRPMKDPRTPFSKHVRICKYISLSRTWWKSDDSDDLPRTFLDPGLDHFS